MAEEPHERQVVMLTGAGGMLGSAFRRLVRTGEVDWRLKPFSRDQMDVGEPGAFDAALESAKPDLVLQCAA